MWTDEIVGTDNWQIDNSAAYVEADYWDDDYVEDVPSQWDNVIVPDNTWVQIG